LRASGSNTNTNCNSHRDTNGDGHACADRNANAVHREMRTNAKAAPDTSAQAKSLARTRRLSRMFTTSLLDRDATEKNDERR